MRLLKRIERLGRTFVIRLLGLVFRAHLRPVSLPAAPHILVVRLDERVGNMLLLLPLLESLKLRFPRSTLDLLASVKNKALIASHPALSAYLPFCKKALFSSDGPLRAPWRLRQRRYDLAIDAANPTDPSATQAILVRLSGATHTIGVNTPDFGRIYSAPVELPNPDAHEIDLRLALLTPLSGSVTTRRMRLATLPPLPTGSAVDDLVGGKKNEHRVVLNIGARLAEKRLKAETYASLAQAALRLELNVILTYGPVETALAALVHRLCSRASLAPPTSLVELGHLFRASQAVITCDTGPMHLAVAAGTPTCGIFVSTEPNRYGHPELPHLVVDARDVDPSVWLCEIERWLKRTLTETAGTA